MQKVAWGRGKLEVLASREEILNLLDQGATRSAIYKKLVADEKITIKYVAFARHVKALIAPPTPAKTACAPAPSLLSPSLAPTVSKTEPASNTSSAADPAAEDDDDHHSFNFDAQATDDGLW